MAGDLKGTAKRLISALNTRNHKLVLSDKQFMGREGKPHYYYTISEATWNSDKNQYDHTALYSTASMIRIVLYLRDMWYEDNEWELPTDQEKWNQIRKELREKKDG